MALSNYSELKSAVADWLNRDDLTSVIPDFITMVDADINADVRHWRMVERSTATATGQYVALPTGWLEPIRLVLTGTDPETILQPAGALGSADEQRRVSDTAGQPRFYALVGGEIELSPPPDQDYDLEFVYYEKVPAMSADTDTNWLLTNHPDVYLNGALFYANLYLGDDTLLGRFEAAYERAQEELRRESWRTQAAGGLRMKAKAIG